MTRASIHPDMMRWVVIEHESDTYMSHEHGLQLVSQENRQLLACTMKFENNRAEQLDRFIQEVKVGYVRLCVRNAIPAAQICRQAARAVTFNDLTFWQELWIRCI